MLTQQQMAELFQRDLRFRASRTQVGIICLCFGWDFCRGGKNVPEIRFGLLQGLQNRPHILCIRMQGMQKHAWDFGQAVPQGAKPCPEISLDFCTGCKTFPQILADFCTVGETFPGIQFILYPGGNFLPEIWGRPYPGGNNMPEIRLGLSHGGVNLARDSRQVLPRWKQILW